MEPTAHRAEAEIGDEQPHFWSVVIHEAGHYAGVSHTATSDLCSEQTMYPFLSAGDNTKESLGVGDIAGIGELY